MLNSTRWLRVENHPVLVWHCLDSKMAPGFHLLLIAHNGSFGSRESVSGPRAGFAQFWDLGSCSHSALGVAPQSDKEWGWEPAPGVCVKRIREN